MAKKRGNGPRVVQIPLRHRLTATYLSDEECKLAIQGKQVPQAVGHKVTQACVVRGIRSYSEFATELHGTSPIFTRALNARQIMSNCIPQMSQPEEFPYCIWYPDVAKEDTYRELARQYPQMKYHVGRACAVAGYTDLYRELDLHPEVHIAEDARDNGSHDIFQDIMDEKKKKVSIMDDYKLSVNVNEPPMLSVNLNGDTAVRSTLDLKRKYSQSALQYGMSDCYFNITEDFGFDTVDSVPQAAIVAKRLAVKYLYTPLPMELPPLQKDVLILLAAYNGDIDRYARLRRPGIFLSNEHSCVIRGSYHSTFFAKWWSVRLQNNEEESAGTDIESAVTARAIMDNDLSRVTVSSRHIPYCIWYPKVPRETTLELLVKRRPDMVHQVARACIVANYQSLYDKLDPVPDFALFAEAKATPNTYYLADLNRKASGTAEEGNKDNVAGPNDGEEWKRYTRDEAFKPSIWSHKLQKEVGSDHVITAFAGLYDGMQADISMIELHASVAEDSEVEVPGDCSTAFGGPIDERLVAEGLAELDIEYGQELSRIAGQGPASPDDTI